MPWLSLLEGKMEVAEEGNGKWAGRSLQGSQGGVLDGEEAQGRRSRRALEGRDCEWEVLHSELSAPPSFAWCSVSSLAPSLQSWSCRRPWSVSEDHTGSQIRFSPRMTGQFCFCCCKSRVAHWALVGGSTNHIKGGRSFLPFIPAYSKGERSEMATTASKT